MNTKKPANSADPNALLRKIGKALDALHLADDASLEAFLHRPLSKEEEALVDRLTKRVQGRLEKRPASEADESREALVDDTIAEELFALHRNEGELTAEQREKLEQLRKNAREAEDKRRKMDKESDSGESR